MARGEDWMKHLKILHLEDNAMKQTAIARVLHDVCEAEIDWVTDVASGMKKIEEIKEQGDMYDLAITDMQYPLKKGTGIDEDAGEVFIGQMKDQNVEIPITLCCSCKNLLGWTDKPKKDSIIANVTSEQVLDASQ